MLLVLLLLVNNTTTKPLNQNKMKAKEKAQELVNKHIPLVYCYMGSGMLTNDYDEKIAIGNAKKSALISVDEILDSYTNEKSNGFIISDKIIPYWEEVKQEITNF